MWTSLLSDVRVAWRSLRRSPGYALGIAGTLTLGTAPAVTLFTLVYTVLFSPISGRDPDRVMLLTEIVPALSPRSVPFSPADFLDLERENRSFTASAAVEFDSFTLTGRTEPVSVDGARVSRGFFAVTQLSMLAGRTFLAEEDQAGQAPVVVLNESTWRRFFGADQELLGKPIEIDGRDHEVVGIARASFLSRHDFWVPLALDPASASRTRRYLAVMAELRPGVSVAAAREDANRVAALLAGAAPEANRDLRITVDPLLERLYRNVRPAMLGLLAAGLLVLLLACVNVASLMLAKSVARQREMAIRGALGVGRWPLARYLLVETGLLVAASALAGLAFTWVLTSALSAVRVAAIPRIGELGIGSGSAGFALALTLLATLGCSLLPIRYALRSRLTVPLQGARRARGLGGFLRGGLVVIQVALATVLVTGACLTLLGFQRLSRVELGFDPTNVLSFELNLPAAAYPDAAARRERWRALLARLAERPGTESVALVSPPPLSDRAIRRSFFAEGAASPEAQGASERTVSPSYFATLDIPLLAGRGFAASDDEAAPRVAVVNRALARAVWPGAEAVGKRLSFDGPDFGSAGTWTVIGVVADARQMQLNREVGPEIVVSYLQSPRSDAAVLMRSPGDPFALARTARDAVRALDPSLAMRHLRPLPDTVAEALAQPRYASFLLAFVAALALGLAAVGVYGVLHHATERRAPELGIRMALGAERRQILGLVARQGALTVGLGALVGLVGAFGLGRLLSRLVYGLRAVEPGALLAALALLSLAAAVAIAVPARRAARADPARSLRLEA